MIWSYYVEKNEHHFQLKGQMDNDEGWHKLQQQILLLLEPKPKSVIRLTIDCSQMKEFE